MLYSQLHVIRRNYHHSCHNLRYQPANSIDVDTSSYNVSSTISSVTIITATLLPLGSDGIELGRKTTSMITPNETPRLDSGSSLDVPDWTSTITGPTIYRTITLALAPAPNAAELNASTKFTLPSSSAASITSTMSLDSTALWLADATDSASLTQSSDTATALPSTTSSSSNTGRAGFDRLAWMLGRDQDLDTVLSTAVETFLPRDLPSLPGLNESNPLTAMATVALSSSSPLPIARTGPCATGGTTPANVRPLYLPEMLGHAYGGGYIATPSICVTMQSGSNSGIPPGYGFSVSAPSDDATGLPPSPVADADPSGQDAPSTGSPYDNTTIQAADPPGFLGIGSRHLLLLRTNVLVLLLYTIGVMFIL